MGVRFADGAISVFECHYENGVAIDDLQIITKSKNVEIRSYGKTKDQANKNHADETNGEQVGGLEPFDNLINTKIVYGYPSLLTIHVDLVRDGKCLRIGTIEIISSDTLNDEKATKNFVLDLIELHVAELEKPNSVLELVDKQGKLSAIILFE